MWPPKQKRSKISYIDPDYYSLEFPAWAQGPDICRCFWCHEIYANFQSYTQHARACTKRPFVYPPY
ncbi:hypothetical protein H4S00_002726 [Coemansia sp. D1744]|nr:hypothetical protein J3F81_004595 [Coemansia sp. RSA 371]KAJ2722475.1 hypothetical protein H4S00_002726 [Coemansia sp. D1744]